jgi:glycosyltransferase involved in cell wall biosynthesis
LIRTYPDEVRNGFDAYAYSLINMYGRQKVDFDVQTAKNVKYINGPKLSPIFYDMLYPLSHIFKRRSKETVYHAISESQALIFPFIKGRKVVTVHHIEKIKLGARDLLKINTVYNMFWRYCTNIAVRQSDRIICISEQTRKELIGMYRIDEDKISIVSQAISDRFIENDSVRNGRMIGYIGPFTARKNIPALFQVFKDIHKSKGFEDIRMKICGSGPSTLVMEEIAADPKTAENVLFKGEVPDMDVVNEYNELSAMLYPSFHEGFGLGILEAQKCGIPVFILQDAKIPEEVTRCAIKCASPQDMAKKVMDYLQGDLHYEKKRAIAYATTFSEEARAKRTLSIYEELDHS